MKNVQNEPITYQSAAEEITTQNSSTLPCEEMNNVQNVPINYQFLSQERHFNKMDCVNQISFLRDEQYAKCSQTDCPTYSDVCTQKERPACAEAFTQFDMPVSTVTQTLRKSTRNKIQQTLDITMSDTASQVTNVLEVASVYTSTDAKSNVDKQIETEPCVSRHTEIIPPKTCSHASQASNMLQKETQTDSKKKKRQQAKAVANMFEESTETGTHELSHHETQYPIDYSDIHQVLQLISERLDKYQCKSDVT